MVMHQLRLLHITQNDISMRCFSDAAVENIIYYTACAYIGVAAFGVSVERIIMYFGDLNNFTPQIII